MYNDSIVVSTTFFGKIILLTSAFFSDWVIYERHRSVHTQELGPKSFTLISITMNHGFPISDMIQYYSNIGMIQVYIMSAIAQNV